MTIGLGTFAYFWRQSSRMETPMTLEEMIDETADLGVDAFQICDYAGLEQLPDARLTAIADLARRRGIVLEVGTRGVDPAHLARFAHVATVLGATMVRSMLYSGEDRPAHAEAVARLREAMPEYRARGLSLALETYEQVPTRDLLAVLDAVDEPNLGICLDPGNTVAALENPHEVVRMCAPRVLNYHVKDFAFTRTEGWVGFQLAGCPLGEGLLDYPAVIDVVRPDERGISQIIEHWLPWQGDAASTARLEAEWTIHNLTYLKEHHND